MLMMLSGSIRNSRGDGYRDPLYDAGSDLSGYRDPLYDDNSDLNGYRDPL